MNSLSGAVYLPVSKNVDAEPRRCAPIVEAEIALTVYGGTTLVGGSGSKSTAWHVVLICVHALPLLVGGLGVNQRLLVAVIEQLHLCPFNGLAGSGIHHNIAYLLVGKSLCEHPQVADEIERAVNHLASLTLKLKHIDSHR